MQRIDDMGAWGEACLDTPIFRQPAETAEEAAKHAGNHVKSREREQDGFGWPKFHGVLVYYEEFEGKADGAGVALVRSIGSPVSPPGTVWVGSTRDYHLMWEVD